MNYKAIKIGLTTLVLATGFGGLLWSSLREDTEYYKHVDEVMSSPAQWQGKRLQLHGFVAKEHEKFLRKPGTLDYVFQVENNGHRVWARYSGIVPDTFKEEAEVVLKGTLKDDGFYVEPNGIMAKCPSKYEPKAAPTSPPPLATGT